MDFVIARAMCERKVYDRLRDNIPKSLLAPDTVALLGWIELFYATYPDSNEVHFDVMDTLLNMRGAHLQKEQMDILKHMLKTVQSVPDEAVAGTVRTLNELAYSGEMAALVSKYQAGEEVDFVQEAKALERKYSGVAAANDSLLKWEDGGVDDILAATDESGGLRLTVFSELSRNIRGLRGGDCVAVAAPVDAGKCLAVGTPVILADGSTVAVEDVKVGDVLAGPYRNNVVQGTTKGTDIMYEVTYPWGESYIVNSAHILSLVQENKKVVTYNVADFCKSSSNRTNSTYKGWKAGIQMSEAVQPMPAYLLGLWLADGTSSKPQVTTMDLEVVSAFNQYYGEASAVYTKGGSKASTYAYYKTKMLDDLKALKVLGNKHIPDAYLRASTEQRKQLLAGIVDGDGYLANNVQVVSKFKELADQIVWLSRSLGLHATVRGVMKKCPEMEAAREYYEVNIGAEFYDANIPLQVQRRKDIVAKKAGKPRKRKGLNFGITVKEVGAGEYAGFSLDGDHLFLLGDFTVTHNTSLLAATVVSLAEQMHEQKEIYAERPILWLVNESLAKRTVPRIYQAATGLTLQQIVEQHKEGKFADKYLKKVGTWDKIRVKDAHSMSLGQISTLLEEMRPAVLVCDMVANIKGGNAESEYQALEQKWQQLRMLGCEYDCIILGTIQLSVEGYDCMYPPLTALKGSKIGVQGALDLCIMMGRMNVNDRPDMANVRGISTPKNKLGKSGSTAYVQFQVEFNGGTCQFTEGLI